MLKQVQHDEKIGMKTAIRQQDVFAAPGAQRPYGR